MGRRQQRQSGVLVLQMLAGLVVVVAFAGAQARRLDPFGPLYLLANASSTGLLAAVALSEGQYGFVLTNGFWAAISTVGLVRSARATTEDGRAEVG